MNSMMQQTPFAIGESVNDSLRKNYVAGVTCQCAGSQVILRGLVDSFRTKERALRIARQLCGMREIADEINVHR